MSLHVQTWYEVYNEAWNIDMKASIDTMISKLEARNPGKYAAFLKSLKKIKTVISVMGVPYPQERSDILYNVYFALRLLDDVIDGDTPLHIDYNLREQILLSKQVTEQIGKNQQDLFDALIGEALNKARHIWIEQNIIHGVQDIVDSFKFDASRIAYAHTHGMPEQIPHAILDKHHDRLDVEGTIFDTGELFGLNPHYAVEILRPLWLASRYVYTLQDILEEPWKGILNIPKEDILKYNISAQDIQSLSMIDNISHIPYSIKLWIASVFDKIDEQLQLYKNNMREKHIPLTYTKNKFKTRLYNVVLKKIVLKKWYVDEIEDVRKQFMPIVLETRTALQKNFW